MFWYWFLMIPDLMICYADPSILLIGGWRSNGTIEEFDLKTMTSKIIQGAHYSELDDTVHAAAVNDTHAIVFTTKSFFIDIEGNISPGPEKYPGTFQSDIATMCDANGRRQVIVCGRKSVDSATCEVLSEDGRSFEEHSTMSTLSVYTLTAFGNELIVVGSEKAERYDGSKWKEIQAPPVDQQESTAVKLNDDQLMSCSGIHTASSCYLYNLGSDEWVDGPEVKSSVPRGGLAMVGQTVYAFKGGDTSTVQTLDVSNGIDKAEWQLQPVPLKVRRNFGVWVVGSSHACQTTTTDGQTTVTTSGSMETDGAVTDGQGLGYSTEGQGLGDSTTATTSGSMVTDGHLLGMILMALLVFTYRVK